MGSGNDRADADLSSISEKQKDDSSARAAAPASNPVFLGSIGFSFGDVATTRVRVSFGDCKAIFRAQEMNKREG